MSSVKPYYSNKTKKEEVADMFDNISHKYDFLNHFLSLGIDISWRKKAVKMVLDSGARNVLDVATGTADLAIMMAKKGCKTVTGSDISEGMLAIGREKVTREGLDGVVTLQSGDGENLPFPDNTFDAITVSFGIRNFENVAKGLQEMNRVLKKDGTLFVLEFSNPKKFPGKQFYQLHFKFILPFWGRIFSKDTRAYTYLPESVKAFPDGQAFLDLMTQNGFRTAKQRTLSLGVASIYSAKK